MQTEVKESTEIQNPIDHLGEYGQKGGPGRPKGLKNKYTLIKKDLLDAWTECNGKERFKELLRGSRSDFVKALDKIIAILPKDLAEDLKSESSERKLIIVYPHDSNWKQDSLESQKEKIEP